MADGDLIFIPTDPDVPHPLGRSIVWHDPRNRNFRALSLAGAEGKVRTEPWNRASPPFDQVDSNCTAEAAVGLLRSQPHSRVFGTQHFKRYDEEHERVKLYKYSQQFDPWEGENYDGTSTDAPFRAFRALGVLGGWSWLFGIDEVVQYLTYHGAVVVGTVWYKSMFDPDATGSLNVDPRSGVAGGHAYEVVFSHPKKRYFEIVNSWGAGWGKLGRARLSYDAMAHLLSEQGEAATVPGQQVLPAA